MHVVDTIHFNSHSTRLFSLISFLFHLRVTRWSLAYTNNGIKYNKSSASSVWRRSDELLDSKLLTILTHSVHFEMAKFSEITKKKYSTIDSSNAFRQRVWIADDRLVGQTDSTLFIYIDVLCACVSLRLFLVFSARYPRFVGCYLNNWIAWNTHVVRISIVGAVALYTDEPRVSLLLSIYCYCYLPLQKR